MIELCELEIRMLLPVSYDALGRDHDAATYLERNAGQSPGSRMLFILR